MRPPVIALSALLCLVLALSACGSSGEDTTSFSTGYNAAIAKLDRASTELAGTKATTRAKSSAAASRAIARQLDRFADLLAVTSTDLHRLKPPSGASGQFKALTAALDQSIASARRAAHAAREIQPLRQRKALRDLRDSVVEVSRAQDALQRAVRAG